MEIKAARAFDPSFLKSLRSFQALDNRIQPGALIYAGDQEQPYKEVELINFKNMATLF